MNNYYETAFEKNPGAPGEDFHFAVGLAINLLSMGLYGFVLAMCWEWFVTPLGVPPIGIWQGAGLRLTGWLLAAYGGSEADIAAGLGFLKRGLYKRLKLFQCFVAPVMLLIAAAIIHAMMGWH